MVLGTPYCNRVNSHGPKVAVNLGDMILICRKLGESLGCAMLLVAVAACGSDGDEKQPTTNELEPVATRNAIETPPAEPPPMVVRSPSYRCDDGRALYVDVLTDENAVNVRDSRADVPKLLRREEGTDPFTGADRSLSGIGDEVRYSGPGRPQQSCRAAPA